MTDLTVFDLLPEVFPLGSDTVFGVVADTAQGAFDTSTDEAQAARDAHYLETSEDEELTQYGKRFKTIGKRRGRGEEEYRRFLRGIVVAYQGDGSGSDIRTAIGAGLLIEDTRPFVGVGSSDGGPIELTPHYDTLQFDLTIHDHAWASHPGDVVGVLAEYADASVVDLRELEYRWRASKVQVGRGGRQVKQTRDTAKVGVGAGERHVELGYQGRFDGIGSFSGDDEFGAPDKVP